MLISNTLEGIDYLDDGSPIALKITIDTDSGSAIFDFEGTGPELRGNLNAPICVVHAAVIYWYVKCGRPSPHIRFSDEIHEFPQLAINDWRRYPTQCRLSRSY